MRPGPPPLPPARDLDVVLAEVLGPLAHPRPLDEGRTACGDTERQAHPATLSKGGGVREAAPRHPSPSSTAPEGRGGGIVC